MIVDASAMLAVILDEPERGVISELMVRPGAQLNMSPVNYLEVMTKVLRSNDEELLRATDDLFAALGITLASVTAEQARIARQAYQAFGKGRHPAKLNIGDCFAYALSKARGEPLLFKGEDFRRTDIEAAL